MREKILILGTSNSLLKDGYGTKLLSNPKFERYSIGDTTSLSGIYNILRIKELSEYKYAILDFYVNELTFMLSINYPFTWIVSSFMFLIKYLISEGIMPIIVIINKDGFRWLDSYQKQIANKYGLTYIDLMDELRSYDKSPYRNDSVHYNLDVQNILFKKIVSTIDKLNTTGFVLPNLVDFPEVLQQLKITNLNSTMIGEEKSFLRIKKKNSIFSLDMYEINKLRNFSIKNSNKIIALVYYSDERTSCICVEQNGNKVIKNLHHKHPKPLLTVRSVDYENNLLNFGNIVISIEPKILDITEFTYNTIQNGSCQDPHLLINDILFTNIDLRECGKQLIDYLDLHDYEIKYKLWYFLKQNKTTYNESKIIDLLKSLREDYKCSAEYLYYLQKYNKKKDSIHHMIYKNMRTENYYIYQLIAMFFLTNIEEKIVFYKKAISICKNDFSLFFLYAETLYKASYLYEALDAINTSLNIKDQDIKALNLKLKILIALSSQHYSIYKNYLSEIDQIKQLLLKESSNK